MVIKDEIVLVEVVIVEGIVWVDMIGKIILFEIDVIVVIVEGIVVIVVLLVCLVDEWLVFKEKLLY